MKKFKFLLYLAFGVMLVQVGCADLDENPDFINTDEFFNNADELLIGLNGVYDDLGFGSSEWFNHFYNRYVFECLVGYQVGWEKGPLDFQNGNVNPGDPYIEAYWKISYRSINRANTVIEAADRLLEEGAPDGDLIARIRGEALFLRSYYYFNLIRYFDDVPFTVEKVRSDQQLASNEDGRRKVLDMMSNDLTEAANALPEMYDDANLGRPTKWAALALQMKGFLQDEKWNEAFQAADNIIQNSGLTLFDDFVNNFEVAFENTGERIFETQVSALAATTETNNHHAHFVPADLPNNWGGVGWHWLYGTKDFRMMYEDDDKRIPGTFIQSYPTNRLGQKSGGEWPLVTWSEDADFDLNGGLVQVIKDADGSNIPADDYTPEQLIYGRPHSGKYVELRDTKGAWDVMEKNIVLLRYADVLLGHSEAANESGTGNPFFGINEVRNRAGLIPLAGLSQSELRNAIVNERILEFAFEQEIYPELKRKSTFGGDPDYLGDYIRRFIDTYGVDRQVTARDYVLPIPLGELIGNPNVEQSDVWK